MLITAVRHTIYTLREKVYIYIVMNNLQHMQKRITTTCAHWQRWQSTVRECLCFWREKKNDAWRSTMYITYINARNNLSGKKRKERGIVFHSYIRIVLFYFILFSRNHNNYYCFPSRLVSLSSSFRDVGHGRTLLRTASRWPLAIAIIIRVRVHV